MQFSGSGPGHVCGKVGRCSKEGTHLKGWIAAQQIFSLSLVPQIQSIHVKATGREDDFVDSLPPAGWRRRLRQNRRHLLSGGESEWEHALWRCAVN